MKQGGWGNGFLPAWNQAITQTMLMFYQSYIWIKLQQFLWEKMHLKMSPNVSRKMHIISSNIYLNEWCKCAGFFFFKYTAVSWNIAILLDKNQQELEQLERLRSEDTSPPPPHGYPYHWVILDPKSKEDKVKVTNLKNSPKFQFF